MSVSTLARLSGVFPVLPSVFDDFGRIDESGLRKVLEYAIGAGADGVVFPGSASEYQHLTAEERDFLVDRLGKWIDGRAQYVVGASADSPEEIVHNARLAATAGANAAMILTPHSLAHNLDAMAQFYAGISGKTGLPIILQNAPKPLGIGLSVAALSKLLLDAAKIAFVKEEMPPCGQRITALISQTRGALHGVFGGAGGRYVIDELNRGTTGTMPASEVVEIHVAIADAHRNGDIGRARNLFERCLPLLSMQAIYRWRLTKEVLLRRGLIESTYTRAPGPELDSYDHVEVDVLLNRMGDLIEPIEK